MGPGDRGAEEPGIQGLRAALWLLGLGQLVGALALAPGFALSVWLDPTRSPFGRSGGALVVGALVAAYGVGLALGCAAAARGIGARRPWAPRMALLMALIAVPSACGPVALVVLGLLSARRSARMQVAPRPAGGDGAAAPASSGHTTRALEES